MRPSFDENWRTRALAGDAAAVAEMVGFAMTPLFRFCFYRLGRNRHLCEDAVQETVVRAMRDLAHYDPVRCGGDIFPWLTGLARNEIRRLLAGQPQAVSLEALWLATDRDLLEVFEHLESQRFGEEVLRRDQTRQMVNMTMSQLPPQYGRALEAKYLMGRSVRQIALAWKTSETAVESQLARARAAFKAAFVALARNLKDQLEGNSGVVHGGSGAA